MIGSGTHVIESIQVRSVIRFARCTTLTAARIALVVWATQAQTVRAQQVLVLDTTYTATADNTQDSHYAVDPAPGIPANWRTPVDYANGSAYVQLDILEKPSAQPTLYNICFENSSNAACMPYSPAYTATGRDDFNAKLSAFYQYDVIDWTKGVSKIQLILKDTSEKKKQGDPAFYPTKVHVTISVVAAGTTYKPPSAGGEAGAGGGSAGQAGNAGASGNAGAGGNAGSGGSAGRAAAVGDAGVVASAAGVSAAAANSGAGRGAAGNSNSAMQADNGVVGAGAGSTASAGKSGSVSASAAGERSVASALEDNGGCSAAPQGHGQLGWLAFTACAIALRSRIRARR